MTREEHMAWCKERALEYVDQGDLTSALASMMSDLTKHEETAGSAKSCGPLGMMLMMSGQLSTPHQMRHFINGFN